MLSRIVSRMLTIIELIGEIKRAAKLLCRNIVWQPTQECEFREAR
jgi:hypothetical protein